MITMMRYVGLKKNVIRLDNRFSRILWIMLITLKRSPVIRFLDNFMVALLGTFLGMAVMFAIVLFSLWIYPWLCSY
jgi:hypothetical protein